MNAFGRVVLLIFAWPLGSGSAFAQCRPPVFGIGQDYGVSLFVSLRPSDFTVDRLICVAQTLKTQRSDPRRFSVLFFDSPDAARHFQGMPVEGGFPPAWNEWAKRLHAVYSFDADKPTEGLDIMPLGFQSDPSKISNIALPPPPVHHCRLELAGRCLIAAFEKITYPLHALRTRASGKIEVTAIVNRDGGVSDLHLAAADVRPDSEKRRLANAAVQDLKTWRFDATAHDDPIRVVYSFAVEAAPGGDKPKVEWVAPGHVEVRGNPRR